MSAPKLAGRTLLISRSAAREAIGKAIRLYVGRGRRYSFKELGNGTGIPDRLLETYVCDPECEEARSIPPEHLLSIASFLGEDFTTEWLRLAKQGAFALPDDDIPTPGELVADCAEDTAEIADAGRDGEFGGDDKRTLRSVGLRSIDRGMRLVAGASK